MAVVKLLKAISKTKQQQAQRLFRKHKNGTLNAREVEKQLNNLGLKGASPYGESKSTGLYQVAPKAEDANKPSNTIVLDLRNKKKAK